MIWAWWQILLAWFMLSIIFGIEIGHILRRNGGGPDA